MWDVYDITLISEEGPRESKEKSRGVLVKVEKMALNSQEELVLNKRSSQKD